MTNFNENFNNEEYFFSDKKETSKKDEPKTVSETEDIVEDVRPGEIREENPKK